jgi:hypothetical protein
MKILQNSVPRSGSHLLAAFLGLKPVQTLQTRYNEYELEFKSDVEIIQEIVCGNCWFHAGHTAGMESYISEQELPLIFLTRDPRDIIISRADYVEDAPTSPINGVAVRLRREDGWITIRYSNLSYERRIDLMITDCFRRFNIYNGWLESKNIVHIHYEDLVAEPQKTTEKLNKALKTEYNWKDLRDITATPRIGVYKERMFEWQTKRCNLLYKNLIGIW